jgi:hypothetical protein
MEIGAAIAEIRTGRAVARSEWQAGVRIVQGPNGAIITKNKADGLPMPYHASSDDLLATDWIFFRDPTPS